LQVRKNISHNNTSYMKHIFILLTFHLFLCATAFAQRPPQMAQKGKGVIKGIVKDQDLKTPLEYTNVILYQQADSAMLTGTITKQDGSFILEDIPFGKYYIIIDFIGYKQNIIPDIVLHPGQSEIDKGSLFIFTLPRDLRNPDFV